MRPRKTVLKTLFLILMAICLGAGTSWAVIGSCDSPARIMPLGDSITQGVQVDNTPDSLLVGYRQPLYLSLTQNNRHKVDFVGSLQNGCSATPYFDCAHEGHPGFLSGQIAQNVYSWLQLNPADIVLLHIGTNDLMVKPAGEDYLSADNISKILDEIYRYNPKILVVLAQIINWQTYNPDVATFNQNIADMALARIQNGDDLILVNMENALSYPDDMASLLHPDQTGYKKMAQVWFNALDNVLPFCGNEPPTKPQLVAPEDNQTGVGKNVTFEWNRSTDPDGGKVNYSLYYCESPDFANCPPLNITAQQARLRNTKGYGAGLLLLAAVLAFRARRKKRLALLVFIPLITGLLLVSCSGGGGTAQTQPPPFDGLSYTAGLNPGTTYYWKVAAVDSNGASSESGVWSFKTK